MCKCVCVHVHVFVYVWCVFVIKRVYVLVVFNCLCVSFANFLVNTSAMKR